jgi:hypothetical protein
MNSRPDRFRTLYRKLLNLYPRAFREQFGESMEQTFVDLFNEREQLGEQGTAGFVLGTFAETAIGIVREHVLLITRGNRMKNSTTNYNLVAVISFLLALPCVLLYSLLVLNIEPNFGPLEPILNNPDPDQPDVVGSLVALSTLIMLIGAFIINLRIVLRARREGKSLKAHPLNFAFAVVMLAFIGTIVGDIIADQYPCWVGVPNCD